MSEEPLDAWTESSASTGIFVVEYRPETPQQMWERAANQWADRAMAFGLAGNQDAAISCAGAADACAACALFLDSYNTLGRSVCARFGVASDLP